MLHFLWCQAFRGMPCLRWFLQSWALQLTLVLDAPASVEPGNTRLQKELLVLPEVAPSLEKLLTFGILGLLPQKDISGGLLLKSVKEILNFPKKQDLQTASLSLFSPACHLFLSNWLLMNTHLLPW